MPGPKPGALPLGHAPVHSLRSSVPFLGPDQSRHAVPQGGCTVKRNHVVLSRPIRGSVTTPASNPASSHGPHPGASPHVGPLTFSVDAQPDRLSCPRYALGTVRTGGTIGRQGITETVALRPCAALPIVDAEKAGNAVIDPVATAVLSLHLVSRSNANTQTLIVQGTLHRLVAADTSRELVAGIQETAALSKAGVVVC